MANQHTQALEQRATELAAELVSLQHQKDELFQLIENPICGKPGRGYKAARKAKRQLHTIQVQCDQHYAAYQQFLYDGKASFKTRQQRAEKFQAALAAIGA